MMSLFYLILAIVGLGFLIFIHELGHYIVARRVGMTVEVFSIGFGPPIRQWIVNGVKWQLGTLPFGGYVKIAGMEKKGALEPHQIPDGFYGKKPIDRIKVALAGPSANVLFAFVVFCAIWLSGGQEKPFQQFTNVIGYIDPQSKLYTQGVRPGDEIASVDGKPIDGYQDLILSLMMQEKPLTLQGNEVNYYSGKKEPFSVTVSNPDQVGVLPAQYLIFADYSSAASPLRQSGIQKGDRIVWVDGELIFSKQQLSTVLNDSKTLLTVERNGTHFLTQVPRLKIADLRLTPDQKNDLDDWQHAAGIRTKIGQLYFIPYLVNSDGVVVQTLSFLNAEANEVTPTDQLRNPFSTLLQPSDRIVAVDGTPITTSQALLTQLQERRAIVVVDRQAAQPTPLWNEADTQFETPLHSELLSQLIGTIGTSNRGMEQKNLVLLPPITLKPLSELDLDAKTKAQLTADYLKRKQAIEKIENVDVREEQLLLLEKDQKRLMLGAILNDELVTYNPPPTTLFVDVFQQTFKTLTNLFSGSISPKALSGPVGIVQALQYSWASGVKDALFWLGFVSLNLAIVNLLPLPVLDGGHILFASIEGIRKKPIKAKTMEKFIIPFVVLLIGLFIFLTYHDIVRLITRLF